MSDTSSQDVARERESNERDELSVLRESEAQWRLAVGQQETEHQELVAQHEEALRNIARLEAENRQMATDLNSQEHEIHAASNEQFEQILASRDHLAAQLNLARDENEQLRSHTSSQFALIVQKVTELQSIHTELRDQLLTEREQSHQQRVLSEQTIADLNAELQGQEYTLGLQQNDLVEAQRQVSLLKEEVSERRSSDQHLENLQAELEALRAKAEDIDDLTSQLGLSKTKVLQLQALSDQQTAKMQEGELDRQRLAEQASSAMNELGAAKRDLDHAQKLLAAFQLQVEQEGQHANEGLQTMHDQISELNQQVEHYRQLAETTRQDAEAASKANSLLKSQLAIAKEELSAERVASRQSSDQLASLASKHESLQLELETIKKQSSETNLVSETSRSAKSETKHQVAKQGERATKSRTEAAKKLPVQKAPRRAVKASAGKPNSGKDDLTRIFGIGPKVCELLASKRITTFSKLAATDVKRLQRILDDRQTGIRGRDPSSWPRQAKLAAAGKWAQLEKLQVQLSSK